VSDLGNGNHGYLELWGANGLENITLGSRLGLPSLGRIVVYDDAGSNSAEMTVNNEKEGLILTLAAGSRRTELGSNARGGYMKFYNPAGIQASYEFDALGNFGPSGMSDQRIKENIKILSGILPKILQINPSYYNYKGMDIDKHTFGVIAQNIQEVFPSLVHNIEGSEYLGVDYSKFGVLAIQAIKEQQKTIEALQEKQEDLLQRLAKLEKMLGQ
jgi:hypothetical protein